MKKLFLILATAIYLLGLVYLLLPSPTTPSIPNSFKSDEPGDTVQHPDQPAFYTDDSRAEVLAYLEDQFSLNLMGNKIPAYRLNYRPEDSTQYVRELLMSYYLEEIVHPLRESLFVNGWNPRLSPISAPLFNDQYDRWAMIRDGKEYQSKVTLRVYYSPVWARLVIWTSIFPLAFLLWKQLRITSDDLLNSVKS